MVAKKEIKDSRLTFTINPEIEKRVREKVESEKRTISGVIVSLLEKWLSGEPIHTDVTDTNQSLPIPPIVDIERMKAEILSEVLKEISTKEKENKTLEPVQSVLVHTDMNQCESITEAPTSPDNDVTHTIIPPIEEKAIVKEYDDMTPKDHINLAKAFRAWMEKNDYGEKTFKTAFSGYKDDKGKELSGVGSLSYWMKGTRRIPREKAQFLNLVISGEITPKTDSY